MWSSDTTNWVPAVLVREEVHSRIWDSSGNKLGDVKLRAGDLVLVEPPKGYAVTTWCLFGDNLFALLWAAGPREFELLEESPS